ncbi:Uncharacterised protein [Oligella urethralis]|uniref:hypothetical protein n=1 Tax=Oligella urethralis TaxID=90245 RepID=UPI000E025A9E|nr:hypothetical protein [Oligella urethralis]SUA63387.1 Uncharacterised protein [Oligella urethralis]
MTKKTKKILSQEEKDQMIDLLRADSISVEEAGKQFDVTYRTAYKHLIKHLASFYGFNTYVRCMPETTYAYARNEFETVQALLDEAKDKGIHEGVELTKREFRSNADLVRALKKVSFFKALKLVWRSRKNRDY